MYIILDKFFFIFHTMLIGFNLFGWTWKKNRLANLITLLLTLLSWSILGIWFGFGHCPSTDWHWKVRARLGYLDMSSSYIKFLIDSFTGLDVSVKLINFWAVALLSIAIAASIVTNTVTIINNHLKKV